MCFPNFVSSSFLTAVELSEVRSLLILSIKMQGSASSSTFRVLGARLSTEGGGEGRAKEDRIKNK